MSRLQDWRRHWTASLTARDRRELGIFVQEDKDLLKLLKNYAREQKEVGIYVTKWGSSEGIDICDVTDKTGSIMHTIGDSMSEFTERYARAHAFFVDLKAREEAIQPSRDRLRHNETQLEKLKHAQEKRPQSSNESKITETTATISQIESDLMVREEDLAEFKRVGLKRSLRIQFDAYRVLGQKLNILATSGLIIADQVPIGVKEGLDRPLYKGYRATLESLTTATNSIRTIKSTEDQAAMTTAMQATSLSTPHTSPSNQALSTVNVTPYPPSNHSPSLPPRLQQHSSAAATAQMAYVRPQFMRPSVSTPSLYNDPYGGGHIGVNATPSTSTHIYSQVNMASSSHPTYTQISSFQPNTIFIPNGQSNFTPERPSLPVQPIYNSTPNYYEQEASSSTNTSPSAYARPSHPNAYPSLPVRPLTSNHELNPPSMQPYRPYVPQPNIATSHPTSMIQSVSASQPQSHVSHSLHTQPYIDPRYQQPPPALGQAVYPPQQHPSTSSYGFMRPPAAIPGNNSGIVGGSTEVKLPPRVGSLTGLNAKPF